MRTLVVRDVTITMADGVHLCADVYGPSGGIKSPVIVERIPYSKSTDRFVVRARYFAEQGYVYVLQDVRGCGQSEGVFYPFFNESADGYQTLTWAANQSFSNGLVGTIGASYAAWTQWLCADMGHPNLITMIPEASPSDFFRQLPYQNGVLALPLLSWLVELDKKLNQSADKIDWEKLLMVRPLNKMDRLCGGRIQAWQDWLKHDRLDGYWRRIAFNQKMGRVKLPVFHVSGWYDDTLIGSLHNYGAMCGYRRARVGRRLQKLLIGPWPHRVNTTSRFGSIDFGEQGIIDLFGLERAWFDYWLKGSPTGIDREAPVRFYIMEANEWREASRWPPPEMRALKLYLHSDGNANTRFGDGRLDKRPPRGQSPDEYSYDPTDPVPFLMAPGWQQLGGPDDYSSVEKRNDVLVYSTDPIEKEIILAGPIEVILYAASSARDTDFTAKLLDARPDGYVLRLNDGVVRAGFRNSLARPIAIIPNRIYEYRINCWATSYLFRKGHRIRLEISSSAFPKFEPNLNTGERIGSAKRALVARQRIYHDAEHPSHVKLPVLVG